jgi:hypothetical protein
MKEGLFMLKSLFCTVLIALGLTTVSQTAFSDDRPTLDERPVFFLQPGSVFTVKQDIFIMAGRTATPLDYSQVMSIQGCYLQSYGPGPRDRVVRAGRQLTLKNVHVGPGFFAVSIDDGKDNVLAQIGCNFYGPRLPLVGELREALCSTFDMDLIDVPVDEVSVHL